MLLKHLLSVLYFFACIAVCYSQPLILQKKDRTKQFSVGDYFTIYLRSPENNASDNCSYSQIFGKLEGVSSDSIQMQVFQIVKKVCEDGKRIRHLQEDFIVADSVCMRSIAKSDISLIKNAGSYKWERTRKGITSAFNVIGFSGFVLGIGGLAIGDENGSGLQEVALWMMVSAIVVNVAIGSKRKFHIAESLKKMKKGKRSVLWKIQ